MNGHHFVSYYNCGAHVAAQCRCPGPKQKEVTNTPCPVCVGAQSASARAEDEVAALRKRVEELEGEARVLIGCPCLCHTGQYGEPHLDCRECVRGCATPSAIDHDHEWALWCEKWRAALDLVGNAQAHAEQAERERDYEQERNRLNVQQWSEENTKLQADLDAARACLQRILGTVRGSNLGYEIEALLENRRQKRG